ncbi:MAG: sulfur carrier protein ThiS, partial [Blastocatellia bacterium]|nr:sulfur carrier protein ThiS [Blastocatellia bacterium]
MQILLNGDTRDIPENFSLERLLQLLDLKPERLAIELNGEIITRQQWSSTLINSNDKV